MVFHGNSRYYQFNNAPNQVFKCLACTTSYGTIRGVASNHGPGCDDYHLCP